MKHGFHAYLYQAYVELHWNSFITCRIELNFSAPALNSTSGYEKGAEWDIFAATQAIEVWQPVTKWGLSYSFGSPPLTTAPVYTQRNICWFSLTFATSLSYRFNSISVSLLVASATEFSDPAASNPLLFIILQTRPSTNSAGSGRQQLQLWKPVVIYGGKNYLKNTT